MELGVANCQPGLEHGLHMKLVAIFHGRTYWLWMDGSLIDNV
jgi:hypothetical protein